MIFRPLRVSPSQPGVKSLSITTVTETTHSPTSSNYVLVSGKVRCRLIFAFPGDRLLEKGLDRISLTQTSDADMVIAALKRSPMAYSRRE